MVQPTSYLDEPAPDNRITAADGNTNSSHFLFSQIQLKILLWIRLWMKTYFETDHAFMTSSLQLQTSIGYLWLCFRVVCWATSTADSLLQYIGWLWHLICDKGNITHSNTFESFMLSLSDTIEFLHSHSQKKSYRKCLRNNTAINIFSISWWCAADIRGV